MSCNRCSAASSASAEAAGAPAVEANWASHRDHPRQCKCGAFLRADGGCTACDNRRPYTVLSLGAKVRVEPVQSTAINAMGYDSYTQQLLVEWKSGEVYGYRGVPADTYEHYVKGTESLGKAVNTHIKPRYQFASLGHTDTVARDLPTITPPAESATNAHLRNFLRDPAEMERNGGLGSAAIAHLARDIRSGQWDWRDDNYPNVATILADPTQPISDEDADTVLRSYRPDWYGDAEDFQEAVTPDVVDRMEPAEATLALARMFEMAQAGVWRVDSRRTEENWQRLTGLYARANLSQLDPEQVRGGYDSILKNSTAAGARSATKVVIGNPTTPPSTLTMAAEEVAFDTGYTKASATALANHPNLDAAGAAMLAKSPDPGVRYTAAISRAADTDTLNQLLKDGNDRVAKGALLNTAGPHAQTAADNRAAGINDNETLAILRRKQHSWRDMPRCGQCGAWTKKSGLCANKRCGGFGRVMAAPQDVQQGKFAVPGPVRRRIEGDYSVRNAVSSTLQTWQDAASHGQFPTEWKAALPGAISELAATGKWESPSGSVIRWKDGNYQLDGIPVPAKNAGEAVKTYFALLDQGNQVEVEVKGDDGKPTGQKEIRPRWRYSDGYEALVAYDSDEPSDLYLQGGKALDAGQSPLTPPSLPPSWKQYHSTGKITVYNNGGHLLIAHRPASENYAWLQEGEDFQVNGKALKQAIKVAGSAASPYDFRPVFQQVWGLPPSSNGQRDLDAPNGVWAAADGYRLMVVAHDGNPIEGAVNVRPDVGKLIPDDATVTMGRQGLAWQGQEGHLFESESDTGQFPDYNRIIPVGEPNLTFRITGPVPRDLFRDNVVKLGVLEVHDGEVFMVVLDSANAENSSEEVGRVKVGETDNKSVSGKLAGINPEYFNDMVAAKPARGEWQVGIHRWTSPITFRHSSRKAIGAVMPMHVKGETNGNSTATFLY